MKILVVRFSSIGDIVLTTPVVRALKTQLEDAQIHFVTKESYRSIIELNPYVDKIHVLESSLGKLIHELRKEKYDLIVDLHNNLRTRILKWRLPVKSVSFNKLKFRL